LKQFFTPQFEFFCLNLQFSLTKYFHCFCNAKQKISRDINFTNKKTCQVHNYLYCLPTWPQLATTNYFDRGKPSFTFFSFKVLRIEVKWQLVQCFICC